MRVKQPPPNGTKSHDLSPTSVAEITTPWHHCLGHYHTSKSPRSLPPALRGGENEVVLVSASTSTGRH